MTYSCFFFNDTATTEIYTLSLHDALPISQLTIGVKASTKGKIFGSVNNIMIADAIKAQKNLEVDRKKIEIVGEAIKEVGAYKANIKLHKDIIVELALDVKAE